MYFNGKPHFLFRKDRVLYQYFTRNILKFEAMYTVLHLIVQSFLSTYIGKICTVSVLKRNYITMKYFVKYYVREVF